MSVASIPTRVFRIAPRFMFSWRGVRSFVRRHHRLLGFTRMLSTLFWLGPWRALAIRYFQWRAANPPLPRAAISCFAGPAALDVRQLSIQLETDGFARGLQLPADLVEEILAYCAAHPIKHHRQPHLDCPAINRLAHDPSLLAVVKDYLAAEPRMYSTQMYWTHPPVTPGERLLQRNRQARFHYDLSDFKAVSVFFYLTDVAPDCGPHVVIPGTQHAKSWRQMLTRYVSDEAAQAFYGDRITPITGPRGSGFFENLACYHKHAFGTCERLLLCLTYVLQRTPDIPSTTR